MYSGLWVIVTGSRRGVGWSIAKHFLQMGANVIGLSKGPASITHPTYHHIQADIADPVLILSTFNKIKLLTSTVDIVINNAATLTSQHAMILPVTAAQSMINTNLLGPFMIIREAAKMMRRSGRGRIISISSMAVSLEPMGDSVYAATKAGLTTLTNVMAKELASYQITCNTLAISAIKTDMLDQLPLKKIKRIISELPIKRFANDNDILNVLDFYASEKSSGITAQTIFLNGVN
jgi:3-oxoacyl-[acyl-carrier protein] reductase